VTGRSTPRAVPLFETPLAAVSVAQSRGQDSRAKWLAREVSVDRSREVVSEVAAGSQQQSFESAHAIRQAFPPESPTSAKEKTGRMDQERTPTTSVVAITHRTDDDRSAVRLDTSMVVVPLRPVAMGSPLPGSRLPMSATFLIKRAD
jgi:hypothetical protein